MDSGEVMDFINFSGEVGFQDVAQDPGDMSNQLSHSPNSSAHNHLKPTMFAAAPHQIPVDAKPRLTKEQHDILEAHYQTQSKPSTGIKREFAESLGVSLDKVNNWFQNRRAKSKQDAKKQAGSISIYPSDPSTGHLTFASDSDCSPAFPSSDYLAMQQWSADEQTSEGLVSVQQHETGQHAQSFPTPADSNMLNVSDLQSQGFSQQAIQDMFDSPQEINRRTLTQEQFDAFARSSGFTGRPDPLQKSHDIATGEQDVLHSVFPEIQPQALKQQDVFAFPYPVGAPMSSNDSSIPSNISDQSLPTFPSSSEPLESANASANTSEWGSSRSSSLAMNHLETTFPVHAGMPQQPQPQPTVTTQWQPGQSVPVDFNAQKQEFRQAAAQARQSPQTYSHEQPLSWPHDEAFLRRDSSTSLLAQSMSHVGITTPQPQQSGSFEVPAPPDQQSIAARRQRPRPSRLPLHALRSQSYSGVAPPGSPGQTLPQQHQQQSGSLTPGAQSVRRIRSTNMINAVAQGRVMKSTPGSAQRSPLNWTFADAINSPRAARHVSSQSQGNLAPPTPMSPNEYAGNEQSHQFHAFQAASGHVSRQPSISESDYEHGISLPSTTYGHHKTSSSPPRTPSQNQQQLVQRVGNNVITENTPPQSAPASQQCFPANIFGTAQGQPQFSVQQQQPQPQFVSPAALPQAHAQSMMHMQPIPMPQQHQFMNSLSPEQQYSMQAMAYSQGQHLNIPVTAPQAQMPLDLSQGVPMMNAQGEVQLFFPQQPQFMQLSPQIHPPFVGPVQAQAVPSPQQMPYSFMPAVSISPSMQVTAQVPEPSATSDKGFFVHQYTPPEELKRAATPRKLPDHGPKSYTFANQGPTDFEKGKKSESKSSAASTTSPASSAGAATTSSS